MVTLPTCAPNSPSWMCKSVPQTPHAFTLIYFQLLAQPNFFIDESNTPVPISRGLLSQVEASQPRVGSWAQSTLPRQVNVFIPN